jgi:hypothetical protein
VPGDVIEAAVKQCEETLHASADTSPEGLKKLVGAFEKYNVTREQIEGRIQCRLEAIRPAQVVQLKKVYASLRDGMSVVTDWFDPSPNDAREVTEQIVSGKKPKAKPAATAEPDDAPTITAQAVHDKLAAAQDRDALDEAADLIRMLPDAEQAPLTEFYEQRALDVVGG